MEARYGIIAISSFNMPLIIELLQCLGDNGAVVVGVSYDIIYNPDMKLYKVYWERFPIVDAGCMIPKYICTVKQYYTNTGRVYRRSWDIEVGEKTIPLGSVVIKEK